jgi:uncharacterized protein (DUF4415 family)
MKTSKSIAIAPPQRPPAMIQIALTVEEDLAVWLRAQPEGYTRLIRHVMRQYMEASLRGELDEKSDTE